MPANDELQRIGVETVVQSLDQFSKDMNSYIKSLKDSAKQTTEFQKTTEKTKQSGKQFSDATKAMSSDLKGMIQGFISGIPVIGKFGAALTGLLLNPVVLATAAVIGLGIGITKLGIRGGEIEGIRVAFANIIAPVLEADESVQDFVDNLRNAAGGAISEVELLTNTNLALAGATGEVRETFARALPQLLQTAQVQAAATGQSVEYLFSSLITGIKRGSPLLIDNTGLVLNMTEAYEAFAEQNTTTVAALTDAEKQIALINATVAAGNEAVAAAGGIQANAATEAAKAQALMADTADQFALAFEPIATLVLQGVNALLSFVNTLVRNVAPVIQFVGNLLQNVFGDFAQSVSGPMQFVLDSFGQLATFLMEGAQSFIRGAANIAAAIGNGLMAGANTFIFPAVIQIATFIADFLSGFSPPKKGPLSTIDQGAANVMEAWTQGFTGAFSPQPIAQVAREVNDTLGSIATLGVGQVENRIKNLDLAIRPFQEQLKIVKDRFEAIQAPADAALNAIDRQLASATQALAMGDAQAAETVRQLNIQREAIEGRLDLEQQRVDAAQIQLSLAQSAQQQERTLLEIQKARLSGTMKETQAIKEVAKAKSESAKKEAKATGTGAATPVTAAAASSGLTPEQQAKVGEFTGGDLTNPFAGLLDFGAGIGEDFLSGLSAGGELEQFQSNIGALGEQVDRIASSDPVQGIVGLFDTLGTDLADAAKGAVDQFVGFFTDPNQEGSLAKFISRVNTEGFSAVFGDITTGISNWTNDNLVPAFQSAADLAMSVFKDPADPDSFYSRFQRASADFSEFVGNVGEPLRESIDLWFTDNLITPIKDTLDPYFDIASEDGFFAAFMTMGADIGTAAGDLLEPFEAIFAPIIDWALGRTEGGGLPQIVSDIVSAFAGLPRSIFNALANIGLVFYAVIVDPLQAIIDTVVEIFNNFVTGLTDNQLVNWLRTNYPDLFGGIPTGVQLVAPQLPRPALTPIFPTEQQTGGITQGPGAVRFHGGEVGMLMQGASMATFNRQFVDAMNLMSNNIMMSQSSGIAIPAPANVTNNSNTDNSLTLNANTQNGLSGADILNQLALARIFG